LIDSLAGFLQVNWGNLASVVGAALTVYYSYEARKSADAAKLAATNAKARMVAIDWVIHFGDIVSQIDDVLLRVSQEAHRNGVSADLAKLRSKMAICLSWETSSDEEGLRKRILRSSTQISAIAVQLDTHHLDPASAINIPKINKTLSDQRELYAIALSLAKNDATEKSLVQ
jgi:hypothetical protein